MQNNVTILTERTKALKTPARFIGSVETQEVNKLIVTEDLKSVTEKTINFNQGLFKIVEEVFDNALDECKRHRNNADSKKKGIGNVVSFQIDPQCQWITVSDNGNGIPTTKAKLEDGTDSDMTMYQAAWTKLGAGTNFDGYTNDDSDARGQNGVPSESNPITTSDIIVGYFSAISFVDLISYISNSANSPTKCISVILDGSTSNSFKY